jgi:hypothetical protein
MLLTAKVSSCFPAERVKESSLLTDVLKIRS